MVNAKQLLQDLLSDPTNGVKVYEDDGKTPVSGVISPAWLGKGVFATNGWQISIGPCIWISAHVSDIGAFHKAYNEAITVAIWVLEKRGMNYTAEKLRGDLIQEVDRCLLHFVNNPGTGFDHVNVYGWYDKDEPENGLRRSDVDITVEYQKTRT